jgi:hypothetical protein
MRWFRAAGICIVASIVVLACGHFHSQSTSKIPSFEVIVTDSPFSAVSEQRRIIDRARVVGVARGYPQSLQLKGRTPGEQIRIDVRADDQYLEIKSQINNQQMSRSLSVRQLSSILVEGQRLWLGPDYMHLDSGRACFSAISHSELPNGEIWLAALKPGGTGTSGILNQTRKTFEYAKPSGEIEVPAGYGKTYYTSWKFSSLHAAEFQSRVTENGRVLLEQSDIVKSTDPKFLARAIERYYETDEM